jgi:ABC-type polar amino acid transport system ATPase subunit
VADLRIENLNKNFGAFSAVRDVNITVHEGEFIFLLGPSGCGKTTTLRMIAGLEMPTSGRIEIGRRNGTFLRPRYRNVGMVFQDYGLYRHMTVFGLVTVERLSGGGAVRGGAACESRGEADESENDASVPHDDLRSLVLAMRRWGSSGVRLRN